MKKFAASLLILVTMSFASTIANAQYAQPWQQCGGIGWTGPTECVPGWTCIVINDYYHQCLQKSTGE
jgi:hypothetical protein